MEVLDALLTHAMVNAVGKLKHMFFGIIRHTFCIDDEILMGTKLWLLKYIGLSQLSNTFKASTVKAIK